MPTISQPFVFAAGQDTTGTRSALLIGGDGNPDRGWRGFIYEIVLSSSSLSLDDRQQLEGYLAHKWGLTDKLPANHPYKWDGTLFGGVNITDTDAQTYIAAVEAADGQSLENGVRVAIQDFIVGAKADGIWNAIKSSNILAGARTLNGALIPLKGTAPTNFNFVAGDYNRKTGLVGDGSTKYLDSNRADNADPQNSKHLSVYASAVGLSYLGELVSNRTTLTTNVGNTNIGTRINSTDGTIGPSHVAGLLAGSRISTSIITWRSGGLSSGATNTSQPGAAGNLMIFRSSAGYSTARLAFYSIGEALDLALLDARVTALVNALAVAIP